MKNHQKASFFFIFDTCGKKKIFKGGGINFYRKNTPLLSYTLDSSDMGYTPTSSHYDLLYPGKYIELGLHQLSCCILHAVLNIMDQGR